jgi:peptidyl-prolyl cis-trans isomerase A (cyclophilin A)
MRSIVVFAFAALFAGCANAELEQKVKELESGKAQCDKDLKSAEAAKRSLQQKLAQLQTEAPKVNLDEVGKALGVKPGEKLYATFDTTMGSLVVELFWEKAPNTVTNFVQLAEGTKEWTDPNTGKKEKKSLYNGTIFHRVIPDFMIQGGDPLGNGTGGPGFRFEDEFHPSLKHDGPGVLSMANSGRNTNGSQFFITEKETPWLDRKHSIFGRVTTGLELIPKITRVEKSDGEGGSRPKVDIVLRSVTIGRGAPAAAPAGKGDASSGDEKKPKKKKDG